MCSIDLAFQHKTSSHFLGEQSVGKVVGSKYWRFLSELIRQYTEIHADNLCIL